MSIKLVNSFLLCSVIFLVACGGGDKPTPKNNNNNGGGNTQTLIHPPPSTAQNGTCANTGCHSLIEGMSDAHNCVSCHGGDDTAIAKVDSHPSFIPILKTIFDGEFPLRNRGWNWTSIYDESIAINGLAELRFKNPGDLHVADVSCGATGCHTDIVRRVKLNIHSGMQGDLSQVLFLNGDPLQPDNISLWGGYSVTNSAFDPNVTGSIAAITQLPPIECLLIADPRLADNGGPIASQICPTGQPNCCSPGFVFTGALSNYPQNAKLLTEGEVVSRMYANNDCARCHLWNEGSKRTGDMRSSGCSACHVKYANDGMSKSTDESIDHSILSRPLMHTHKGGTDDDQCAHCHNRGGRIPQAYYGRRERATGGILSEHNPANASYTNLSILGDGPFTSLHGREFPYYIDDENTTNNYDETPPDIHASYGMQCIDCHIEPEVHGDGNIYADRFYEVEIKCETCHGNATKIADGSTLKGNTHPRLNVNGNQVTLTLKSSNQTLSVVQTKTAIDNNQTISMQGHSSAHMQTLECFACHSTWYPNCFSCHVERDDAAPERSWTDGKVRLGKLTRDDRKFVSIDTFVLGVNRNDQYLPEGKYAPFVGFGTFNTYKNGLTLEYTDRVPKVTNGTSLGIPWNKIHPHTNQRIPRNCDECHRTPGMQGGAAGKTILLDVDCDDVDTDVYRTECIRYDRLRVTYGLGSRRYRLDAYVVDNNVDIKVQYVLDRFVGQDRYTINCPNPNVTTDPRCLGPNPVSHTGFRALTETEVDRLFSIVATPQPRTNPAFPNKPPLGTLK